MAQHQSRPSLRRSAAELFDQQMWCLGQDIVHSHGNILQDLGMCQYRSDKGSTLYTAEIEPGGSLFLWGFGAMYCEPGCGSVFVKRYDFAPKLTPLQSGLGIHDPKSLNVRKTRTPQDEAQLRHLTPSLTGWFARYEHWIAENYGTEYRNECLAKRGQSAHVSAQSMAEEWEAIAKKFQRNQDWDSGTRNFAWKPLLQELRCRVRFASSNHLTRSRS
ncbi:MAG: hypothetical protein ACRC8S_18290 [Fimbriiglobus sp.]